MTTIIVEKTGRKKWIIFGFCFFLVYDCVFVINPTERANVRHLGMVQYVTPLKPGLYFKLPLLDSVDRLQVSLTTLHVPEFDVTTVDNQRVTLSINYNYTIPDEQVNHLLYEVGRTGDIDVESNVIPVVKDKTARIFAVQNMVMVNTNREKIQENVEREVSMAIKNLFGIQAHSLQIAGITPSPAFMQSNEAAVKAKNDAVAAENKKRTVQYQADQEVIKANGAADAAIQEARGRSQSVLLEADANRQQLVLEGQGQAARLRSEIEPFGSPDKYIQYLRALAMTKWNGQGPQIVTGSGSSTNVVVPMPMSNAASVPNQQ
ncbi:PHB domain-containing protein [Gammaproteobacteria bacterium]